MGYKRVSPQPVIEGGTGAATLTGVLTGNGTSAVTANAVTQYGTVIAGASNAVTSVAPSATSGVPLISQGAAANPAYGTAVVAGGGTGVASTTAYAVLCGGTTSTAALQSIAGVGTTGQVLTSNGAGALPTFQTGSAIGASLVLIQTLSASAQAAVTFTTGITTTYRNYLLVGDNVVISGSNNILVQFSSNGGSSYISSGYFGGALQFASNSSTIVGNTSSTAGILLTVGAGSAFTTGFTLHIYNLTSTNYITTTGAALSLDPGVVAYQYQNMSGYDTATAMNALQITVTAGTITTGNFSLYGLAH